MKIIVSKKAGYCMGVNRAFKNALEISKKMKNICIYGEMVHNRFALQELTDKGIVIKNDINEIINDEKIINVIIRAHGISPEEEMLLKSKNKNIFDYTCPIVKQVQLLAKKLSDNKHEIIITGKDSHPEVIGIKGYCTGPVYIVKDMEQAEKLPFNLIKNPALISQTTMNSYIFNDILNFLKTKMNNLIFHNTLCNSPIKIQDEAIKLAKTVNYMLVIGDKLSSNTTTLYNKLKEIVKCSFVEEIKDINIDDLKNLNKIGLTGGSSTPQWQIENVKNYLEKNLF